MNALFAEEFGHVEPLLPLNDSATLVHANSLRVDWGTVCPNNGEYEVYVCGNPPFVGYGAQSEAQQEDLDFVLQELDKTGRIDYVACWFWKGADYVKHHGSLGFVSTNSICQGLQVDMLWPSILCKGVAISFAYQTFTWRNSAKHNAGVHVVIVGISKSSGSTKRLFQLIDGEWKVKTVSNISPYLLEGADITIGGRSSPLVGSSKMILGNMPKDGGYLIMNDLEKEEFVNLYPQACRWVYKLLGAQDFLKGKERWCLWLVDASDSEIEGNEGIRERVEKVREMRLASKAKSTREFAGYAHLFKQISQPSFGNYILVPRHTSARREYYPLGFFDHEVICGDSNLMIPMGTLYDFSVMSTLMHMSWVKLVGGRIKSDYRYSSSLIYNTFPWPTANDARRSEIEKLGRAVILARASHPDMSIGQLYDPDKMPENLLEAHQALDRAVEKLYRDRPFRDTAERQEYLLARYEELIKAEKAAKVGGKKKSRKATTTEG